MAGVADFAGRVRGYFVSAGQGIGGLFKKAGRDIAITVEERPEVPLPEVEFPYKFPTREEPVALALFVFVTVTAAATLAAVPVAILAYGYTPRPLVVTVGLLGLAVAIVANVNFIASAIERESTQLLRPMVGYGLPALNALHFWLNPLVAVLAVVFILIRSSNNVIMHAAALALVAWMLTGLMLKLPKDSTWNGPMLQEWAGRIHRQPFVYLVIIIFVFVSLMADLVY
jgi:hypothetical protein